MPHVSFDPHRVVFRHFLGPVMWSSREIPLSQLNGTTHVLEEHRLRIDHSEGEIFVSTGVYEVSDASRLARILDRAAREVEIGSAPEELLRLLDRQPASATTA